MKYWTYIILCLAIMFLFVSFMNAEYINRPFGKCELNHSIDYGTFKTCGDLMSEETAKIGLVLILFGLPTISFVILPIFVKRKKKKNANPILNEEKEGKE